MTPDAEKAAEELCRINKLRALQAALTLQDWLDQAVHTACALYQMDPAELGFDFGSSQEVE